MFFVLYNDFKAQNFNFWHNFKINFTQSLREMIDRINNLITTNNRYGKGFK